MSGSMRTVVCWDLVGWGERWFDWGDALGGDKTGFFGRECWVLPRWKFYEWETTRFYEFALSVARRKKSPSRSLRAVALRDLRGGESPSLFDLALSMGMGCGFEREPEVWLPYPESKR